MLVITARGPHVVERIRDRFLLGTLDGSFTHPDGPIPVIDVLITGGEPVALGFCTKTRRQFVDFSDDSRWELATQN